MARHRQNKGRRSNRVFGAGTAVGAFLAFGMGPLTAAPARADFDDALVDLFGEGLGGAFNSLTLDFGDIDAWQVVFDPASWTLAFDGWGEQATWDALLAGLNFDELTGAADYSLPGSAEFNWNDINWLMPFGTGAAGTADDPNGGAGGWIYGTGGAGWDADGTGLSKGLLHG